MKNNGHRDDACLAQAYDELKAEKIRMQTTLTDRCHRLVLESDEKDGEVAVCALHVPSIGAARNKDTHTHTSLSILTATPSPDCFSTVLIEDLKNRISHMRRDNQKNKLLCEVDDWKELVTSLQLDRDSMSQDIDRLQSLLDEVRGPQGIIST
jgi:hypothetical protein